MEEEIRAPDEPQRMRLIDPKVVNNGIVDYSSEEIESDDDMNQEDRDIRIAIERSLKDKDPKYWNKRRQKLNDNDEDRIIDSYGSNKYLREDMIKNLKEVLENPEYKDLKIKLSADINLYEEGIMDKMQLTCENYYELSKLFEVYFPEDRSLLGRVINPINPQEYSVYFNVMESSKKDFINVDAVEIKRRNNIFKLLFAKIDVLKGYEKKVRNLEIILKKDNEDFFSNKKQKIELVRQNYDELKQILISIRNEDIRKEIKKYIKIIE